MVMAYGSSSFGKQFNRRLTDLANQYDMREAIPVKGEFDRGDVLLALRKYPPEKQHRFFEELFRGLLKEKGIAKYSEREAAKYSELMARGATDINNIEWLSADRIDDTRTASTRGFLLESKRMLSELRARYGISHEADDLGIAGNRLITSLGHDAGTDVYRLLSETVWRSAWSGLRDAILSTHQGHEWRKRQEDEWKSRWDPVPGKSSESFEPALAPVRNAAIIAARNAFSVAACEVAAQEEVGPPGNPWTPVVDGIYKIGGLLIDDRPPKPLIFARGTREDKQIPWAILTLSEKPEGPRRK
jgi:hypothetical protein